MAIDSKLLVLQTPIPREGVTQRIAYATDVFSLNRGGHVPTLEAGMRAGTHWDAVQLPSGEHTTFASGKPAVGRVRHGTPGWLTGTAYWPAKGLWSLSGRRLHELVRADLAGGDYTGTYNKAVFELLAAHFPDQEIALYLH